MVEDSTFAGAGVPLSAYGAIEDSPPSRTYLRMRDDAMTADQQIRAKALEQCVAYHNFPTAQVDEKSPRPNFWRILGDFEAYIRDGERG